MMEFDMFRDDMELCPFPPPSPLLTPLLQQQMAPYLTMISAIHNHSLTYSIHKIKHSYNAHSTKFHNPPTDNHHHEKAKATTTTKDPTY